ncbi:MAG: hypothetical protein ACRAVC_15690 [Trichormus sp.]
MTYSSCKICADWGLGAGGREQGAGGDKVDKERSLSGGFLRTELRGDKEAGEEKYNAPCPMPHAQNS